MSEEFMGFMEMKFLNSLQNKTYLDVFHVLFLFILGFDFSVGLFRYITLQEHVVSQTRAESKPNQVNFCSLCSFFSHCVQNKKTFSCHHLPNSQIQFTVRGNNLVMYICIYTVLLVKLWGTVNVNERALPSSPLAGHFNKLRQGGFLWSQ